jgi:predicted regulator of Ras-like GTPase activity (Roadblock/LC7/MglB family)
MSAAGPEVAENLGRDFRELLRGLVRLPRVRGGLIVAPDGFVIASELPRSVAVEPIAALTATLGRELELGASRLQRGKVHTAMFSADDGTLFLGLTPIGFVVLLGERDANLTAVRASLKGALEVVHTAWGG